MIADDELLDDLAQRLGKLVVVERERVGITQDELAARLGVSQNAVTQWERAAGGHRGSLHLSVILALESAFALPQGTFLKRMGVVNDYPDFEAVVQCNLNLTEAQSGALLQLYRVMVHRDDS